MDDETMVNGFNNYFAGHAIWPEQYPTLFYEKY